MGGKSVEAGALTIEAGVHNHAVGHEMIFTWVILCSNELGTYLHLEIMGLNTLISRWWNTGFTVSPSSTTSNSYNIFFLCLVLEVISPICLVRSHFSPPLSSIQFVSKNISGLPGIFPTQICSTGLFPNKCSQKCLLPNSCRFFEIYSDLDRNQLSFIFIICLS